jgi:hypothetical protein
MDWGEQIITDLFDGTWTPDNYPEKRPLLAHYTSLPVLESIAQHGDVWMSHPLMMNDTRELRGGLQAAQLAFLRSGELKERLGEHWPAFVSAYEKFDYGWANESLLHTYLFCLSEHDVSTPGGLLSMWRGYAGDGAGAALVFRTSAIEPADPTPFILSRVEYLHPLEQLGKLNAIAQHAVRLVGDTDLSEKMVGQLAWALFRTGLMRALYTKHHGFKEEREWRLVYLLDMDPSPEQRRFHYSFGSRGAEPRLKLALKSDPLLSKAPIETSALIDRVILGPMTSSDLAVAAVQRMLATHELTRPIADRVEASGIPYRSR